MASATPTPNLVGGTIDNESLRRQKQEMGEALSRAHRTGTKAGQHNGSTPGLSSAAPSLRRSMSLATDQADTVMTDVKVNGTSSTPQPQEDAKGLIPSTQGAGQQVPTAVEELEQAELVTEVVTNGVRPHPETTSAMSATSTAFNYLNQSIVPMERRLRDPGRGKESPFLRFAPAILTRSLGWDFALLASATFMTNPSLANDPRWKLTRYGDPVRTQTGGFIALPPSYRDVRILVNLADETHRRRRHKVFFMHNATVYKESNSMHVPGAFEVRLVPGTNTLVIEVLADLREGERKAYAPDHLQFDFERCTMVLYLNGP